MWLDWEHGYVCVCVYMCKCVLVSVSVRTGTWSCLWFMYQVGYYLHTSRLIKLGWDWSYPFYSEDGSISEVPRSQIAFPQISSYTYCWFIYLSKDDTSYLSSGFVAIYLQRLRVKAVLGVLYARLIILIFICILIDGQFNLCS